MSRIEWSWRLVLSNVFLKEIFYSGDYIFIGWDDAASVLPHQYYRLMDPGFIELHFNWRLWNNDDDWLRDAGSRAAHDAAPYDDVEEYELCEFWLVIGKSLFEMNYRDWSRVDRLHHHEAWI